MAVDRSSQSRSRRHVGHRVNVTVRTGKEQIMDENYCLQLVSDFVKPTKKVAKNETHLFSKESLRVFLKTSIQRDELIIPLHKWKDLQQSEFNSIIATSPRNHYKKHILWTKQNKVWKFPIDNQQGIGNESKYNFSQHLFLDRNVSACSVKDGAFKHFMELICVGLSKNSYLTVKEKEANILWFENYFQQKLNCNI